MKIFRLRKPVFLGSGLSISDRHEMRSELEPTEGNAARFGSGVNVHKPLWELRKRFGRRNHYLPKES